MTASLQKISDWWTLADYERAKETATARIIKRQSRGNVSVQDGWYMTKKKLAKLSKKADAAMVSMKKSFGSHAM
jgi:hypothetical protein